MNRIDIKNKAKKIIATNKWNIWKPALLIYGATFVLEILVAFLHIPLGSMLIGLFSLPLSVGLIYYVLSIVRGKEFVVADIFKPYKQLWLIIAIAILTYIFVFLWSMLFIIPGIIAALSYAMSYYIVADLDKDISATEVISSSKEMMRGYKWDFFVFQLSFIGWGIIVGLTLGIALIYVFPYVTTANAIYYDELKKKRENKTEA